jgi:phenylalanine-4-hydroxylase
MEDEDDTKGGSPLESIAKGDAELGFECYERRKAQIVGFLELGSEDCPEVKYTPQENQLWRTVYARLSQLHDVIASKSYLLASERLDLPRDRVPQLSEVSARLSELTCFRIKAVGGLTSAKQFYEGLGDGIFHSTQYLRNPKSPFYTSEPDVIHELIGHAAMLADPVMAELYRSFGKTAQKIDSEEKLQALSKVFWFTMEVGLIWERGEPRAYGGALLSSIGELSGLSSRKVLPFSIGRVLSQSYDITAYQPILFAATSIWELETSVHDFLKTLL